MPDLKTHAIKIETLLETPAHSRTIFVFVALAITWIMLPTGILYANEETYLELSIAMLEGRTGGFSAFMESAYHTYPMAAIIGVPVKLLGHELASTVLRAVLILLFAAGLTRLFTRLGLSAIDALLALSAFYLLDQQYFGGEWIFKSPEGKSLAYAATFWAMSAALDLKWRVVWIVMAIATYFHLLVGGFWMLAILCWHLSSERDWRATLRLLLKYSSAVLPLVIAIAVQRAADNPIGDIDTNAIYLFERSPHHVAPFVNRWMLWSWLPGVFVLAATMLCGIYFLGKASDTLLRRLLYGCLALQGYLLIVFLASASPEIVRAVGTFFIFRPSSLTLLLTLTVFLAALRTLETQPVSRWVMALLLLPMFTWSVFSEKVEAYTASPVDRDETTALVEHVKELTSPGQIVLLQPGRDRRQPEITLERRFGRPTLTNWGHLPTLPSSIEELHRRDRFRAAVYADGCSKDMKYPIHAIVFRQNERPSSSVIDSCGRIAWEGDYYGLILVDGSSASGVHIDHAR